MKAFLSLLTLVVAIGFFSSCDLDKIPERPAPTFCETAMVSYEDDIRPLIDNNCAYSGCHVGGAPQGDFRTYDGLVPKIEQGLFETRVFDLRDDPTNGMPPDWAPNGPANLTQDQIDILQCWIMDGYPRN
ncbi:MAG: hypothetical protein AAF502_14130 [Bacteroidota bacterium]